MPGDRRYAHASAKAVCHHGSGCIGRSADAEIETLAELLGDLRITRPDQSYTEYAGQAVLFTVAMADGTETTVTAFNPFCIIDGTGWRTAYEPCEALNRFANELLRERGG